MPRPPFAHWLPHAVLVALMVSSGVWLLVLLAPVTKALAVGASLALLTHGPLFRRISGLLGWWPWPETRPHLAASLSLAVLVAASASAVLGVLWAAFGGLTLTVTSLWGVAIHDQARIAHVVDLLAARAGEVLTLYPQVPLTVEQVRSGLTDFLQQTAVGSAFLNTVITGGSGVVIELILTAVVIWWLYVQGPALGRGVLSLLPATEREPIATRLRERAGALVLGSFGNAFVVGIYLGLVAWLIGGFQPVLVAAVAMIVGVMPLLGPVFVWLPLASLLAGQGRWEAAFALAAVAQSGALILDWLLARRAAAAPIAGTGPILLLTLVGGLWGFGLRGLVLAPAAVVLALSAWDALTSLYVEAEVEADLASDPNPPAVPVTSVDLPGSSSTQHALTSVPLPTSSPVKSMPAIPPISAPLRGPLRGRVLVVEDNPINQRVIQRQLSELALQVEVVADGESALTRMRAETWDAVLMDLRLPDSDGLTVTRRWRAHEAACQGAQRLPILAITANAVGTDREACFAAGMDSYLAKPVRLEDLHRALSCYLSAAGNDVQTPPHTLIEAATQQSVPALTDPVLWARLRSETARSDPRMLEELLLTLKRKAPEMMAELQDALASSDWERLRATAHRLKGSAGMLGLPRMATAAKALESAAHMREPAVAVGALAELQAVAAGTFADLAVAVLFEGSGERGAGSGERH